MYRENQLRRVPLSLALYLPSSYRRATAPRPPKTEGPVVASTDQLEMVFEQISRSRSFGGAHLRNSTYHPTQINGRAETNLKPNLPLKFAAEQKRRSFEVHRVWGRRPRW